MQADRQVIQGNNSKAWEKQVENYINEQIRKGQDVALETEDGDVLLLTERSAYKLSDSNSYKLDRNGKRMRFEDDYYALKSRAAGHIDELVKTSEFSNYDEDTNNKHKNDIGEDGFDYRTAYFRDLDGGYYRVSISAGLNGADKTVYSIGTIKKRSFPKVYGSSSKNGGAHYGGEASFNQTIAQPEDIVNTNIRTNEQNDTIPPKNSQTQLSIPVDEDTELKPQSKTRIKADIYE